VFWSKENPNFTQELEHNPPHVRKRWQHVDAGTGQMTQSMEEDDDDMACSA
jgi:hypothetical protein